MRLISSFIGLVIIALGVIYFAPAEIKLKGMETLTGILPNDLQEKAASLLLTPEEERSALLMKLEGNLATLKEDAAAEAAGIIKNSEDLIHELKNSNTEKSFVQIAKEKLVETFIPDKTSTTTVNCN
jgi:hypothetical protein